MKFSSFRDVWQSRKLSLLHHAVHSKFDGRVFLQQAFSVALDLVKEEQLSSAKVDGAAPTSRSASASAARSEPAIPTLKAYKIGPGSLPFQIGALFALYSLHGTQLFRSRVPIRLSTQDMLALMQLRRSLKSAGPLASDALAVLARLVLGCDGGCGALQPAVHSGPGTILYVDSRLHYTRTMRSNKKILANQKEEIETEKVMAAEAKVAASRAAARARGGDAVSRTKTGDAARSLLGLARRLSSSYAAYEKALEYTRVGGAHASRNDNQEIADEGGNPATNRCSKLLREVERFVDRGIPDEPAPNIHGLELLPRSSPSAATVEPSRVAPWTLSTRFPQLPDLPRMSGVSQVERAKSSIDAGARATESAGGAQVTGEISRRVEVSSNNRSESGSGTGGNVGNGGNGTSLRTIRRIGVRDHLRLVEKSLQEAEEQDKKNGEGAAAENREGGASGIDRSAEWLGGGLSTSRTNSEFDGSSASGSVLRLPGGLGNVPRIRGPGSSADKTAGGDESGDGGSIPGASAGVGVARLPGGLGNAPRVRDVGGSAEKSAGHDESNVGRHSLGDSSLSIGGGGVLKLPGGLGNRDSKRKGKTPDEYDHRGAVGVDVVQRNAASDGSRVRDKRKQSELAAECHDGRARGEGAGGTFPNKRGSFSKEGMGETAASVATWADASTTDPLTGSRQPATQTPGNVPCNKTTKRSNRGGGRLNSLPAEGSSGELSGGRKPGRKPPSETSREQGRGCGRPPRSTCLSTEITTGYDSGRIVKGKGNASSPAAGAGAPTGDAESRSSKNQAKLGTESEGEGDPRIASLFRFAAELSSSPLVSSGGSNIAKKTKDTHKRKRIGQRTSAVTVSCSNTAATPFCSTRQDESQSPVDASTQLQSTNNSSGLAVIASAKKPKLTDDSTPSHTTGERTVDVRTGETSSDSASDDGDNVEQPSSTKGTALNYGGRSRDCDTSGQGNGVGTDTNANVSGTAKQGAKGATTTSDCRGEEQLKQGSNKVPFFVCFSRAVPMFCSRLKPFKA